MSRRSASPRIAAAVLVLAATCNHNVQDDFPLSAGFQPLEPAVIEATWPGPLAGDPHPQLLGPVVTGRRDGHDWAHARGYVHAPVARVWEALHDPATSRIHSPGGHWTPTVGVEPFPISFRILYVVNDIITVKWEITYRGGVLVGTVDSPLAFAMRYQKTWGTDHINVESGSLVAAQVDGAPDVTSLEMVGWLEADTQGQGDVAGTLRDLFGNLTDKLASMP